MMYTYIKTIKPDRLHLEIENAEIPYFQYVETVDNTVNLYFSQELSNEDKSNLDSIVDSHILSTTSESVDIIINNAVDFGLNTISQFRKENVLMGITQAGKTGAVTDYLHKLIHYTITGSLYQAVSEIDRLLLEGLPEELEPFITEVRLLDYKNKINTYLGVV